MANYKKVDADQLDADLAAVAGAIREKTGGTEQLAFPGGFTEAIAGIENTGGGGDDTLLNALVGRTVTVLDTDRLTQIGAYGMAYTNSLESINLPNVNTLQGTNQFRDCKNLKSVRMDIVTTIASACFTRCDSLESVDFPEATRIEGTAFSTCPALVNVNIPKATYMGSSAFNGCTALKRVDFPVMETIYNAAFSGDTALEALILRGSKVVFLNNVNAFNNSGVSNGTGYIYVPRELVESYKTALYWSNFASQIRAIEDYPEITGGNG